MKTPLLSICIATYNRANYIGETLESIIPQLTDLVEIVIIDGASTDDTCEVVRAYQEKCSALRFCCLPEKGGVDQDYCKAVDYAQGEYCWLFPDDDLFAPGAVAAVLEQVQHEYSLIVVNAKVMDADFSNVLNPGLLAINSDKIFVSSEFENLFGMAVSFLSFIGGVVIRKSVWMERNAEAYWGTEFVHVGVIFQKPLPGSTLVMAAPLITIRYGNAHWTSRAFNIWMIKWPRLLWSFKDVSDQAKMLVSPREPWRKLKEILYYRAVGAYDYREFSTLLRHNASSWRWKLGAIGIAMLPGIVVNTICRFLFYIVRKNSNKIIAYDLARSKYSNIIRKLQK